MVSEFLNDDDSLQKQEGPELTNGGCGEAVSMADDKASTVRVARWPQRDGPSVSGSCGGPVIRSLVHRVAPERTPFGKGRTGFLRATRMRVNAALCGTTSQSRQPFVLSTCS